MGVKGFDLGRSRREWHVEVSGGLLKHLNLTNANSNRVAGLQLAGIPAGVTVPN